MPLFKNLFSLFLTLLVVLSFSNARAGDEDVYVPSTFEPVVTAKAPEEKPFVCPTHAKDGSEDPNCVSTTGDQASACKACPKCVEAAGGFCDPHNFTDLRYEAANPSSTEPANNRTRKGTDD